MIHLAIDAGYGNYNWLSSERQTQVSICLLNGKTRKRCSVLLAESEGDRTAQFRVAGLDIYCAAVDALEEYLAAGWIGATQRGATEMLAELREHEAAIRNGVYRLELDRLEKRCAELRQLLESTPPTPGARP